MPALGRTDSRLRMVAILLVFAVISTAAGLRLGYWQVVASDELTGHIEAERARRASASQRVVRADIVGRRGTVLAKTSSFDKLVAYPDIIDPDDLEPSLDLLTVLLGLSTRERAEYLETLREGQEDGTRFVTLSQRLGSKQSTRVRDALSQKLLPGYDVQATAARRYPIEGGEPGTSLASHVLGYVRVDGKGGQGIEAYYDDALTTIDPATVDLASLEGSGSQLQGVVEPEALELTLDAKLQRAVEKELHTAYVATKAKSVSAVVMNPKTGAILAVARVPAYHSEEFAAVAADDMSRLRNPVFQDQYEPGSVMKIFTATAALDLGTVTPNTVILDQKKLEFWKYTVRNADHQSQGPLKVKDVIALSRNVATAKLARTLAPNSTQKAAHRLYDLWAKVGLTGKTGVDVPEGSGKWYDPDEKLWSPVELANRAFGQGVSVTLPQLARGVSTIVNGGFLVQPHLAADGEAAQVEPERVLKAKTANQAKDIFRHVTGSVPWYAKGSLIPGYDIGGKTGTAQIWSSAKGKWKARRFNHSFIGFVGGKKQEYVITVRLEEPVPITVKQGLIPLRIESYQLFQMVARATIDKLKMKKSKDPNAGRPIIGTAAAKQLDPVRNRQAIQAAKRSRPNNKKQNTPKQAKSKSGSSKSGSDVTSDPPATASQGT